MARRRPDPWLTLGLDAWALGWEASSVIGMRMMTFAAGGAAASKEAELMVSEKLAALAELNLRAMTGGLGATPAAAAGSAMRHMSRKVRANAKRLSKGR